MWVGSELGVLLDRLAPGIVALDMPIGLGCDPSRGCDTAARRLLGRPRGSSVFPTPTRAALAGRSHARAGDLNAAVCGKRISVQAFNLLPKIREVDRLLAESARWRDAVFETHPEVSFACMNNDTPVVASKKTPAGRAQRQALIAAVFGPHAFPAARASIARADAADDDLADAFACLFTAERIAARRHVTLPDPPPLDVCGLPMRICY
ncbi:hypothetical protein T31B1_05695 [Salinisphaera sp. T31B1]